MNVYKFETLYGVCKNASMKEWTISVEDHDTFSEIVIVHGGVSHKQTVSRRRVECGKNSNKSNATTHYEQAMAEATSKWKKKQEKFGYTTTIDNVTLSTFHAPMLAHVYHPKRVHFASSSASTTSTSQVYVQPKLDGYRMIYDSTTQSMTTRQGKEFTILKQSSLYSELCSLPTGLILDGELCGLPFEALGVLRRLTIVTEAEQQILSQIEYHVYDMIDDNLPFQTRNALVDALFRDKGAYLHNIKRVPTRVVQSEQEIKEWHGQFLRDGYEGTIIRNGDGMYIKKYRSFDLLKLKDFMDAEFEIVGYTSENRGPEAGLIVWIIKVSGGDIVGDVVGDVVCNVRPQGTREQRHALYEQCEADFSKFKGRKLWTKFFEYTADGNLRFPTTKTNSYESYIRDEIN
jgi:DNA ligase-1